MSLRIFPIQDLAILVHLGNIDLDSMDLYDVGAKICRTLLLSLGRGIITLFNAPNSFSRDGTSERLPLQAISQLQPISSMKVRAKGCYLVGKSIRAGLAKRC